MNTLSKTQSAGFTLIELMVTVGIVGILASIAYPNYIDYMIKARRSQGQQYLMDLAQKQQQYILDTRKYATQTTLTTAVPAPTDVATYYSGPTQTLDNTAAPPTYTLKLTARSSKMLKDDGDLIIQHDGLRWRDMNSNGTYESGTDQEW